MDYGDPQAPKQKKRFHVMRKEIKKLNLAEK
jgi:hypothetical protein